MPPPPGLRLTPAPAPDSIAPTYVLAGLVVFVGGTAALTNCAVLAGLIKHSKTGLSSLIIQLALSDILLLGTVIVPELWSINSRTWPLGSIGCVAYQGFSVFTSTLSTYLVVAIALHTLTTVRLGENVASRKYRRDNEDVEEMRSSQHSLVANSDSSTPPRTMNVDYRSVDTRVPVTLPAVFVWILAMSLSVPEFTLAAIIHPEKNISMCSLDSSHQFNMNLMYTTFNLFLPLFIMSTAGAFIIVRLRSKKRLPETSDSCESSAALKLSLWLMCVHVIFCTPRSVVNAYHVYTVSFSDNYFMILLEQSNAIAQIKLIVSILYLLATLIRPLLYISALPHLKLIFLTKYKITT